MKRNEALAALTKYRKETEKKIEARIAAGEYIPLKGYKYWVKIRDGQEENYCLCLNCRHVWQTEKMRCKPSVECPSCKEKLTYGINTLPVIEFHEIDDDSFIFMIPMIDSYLNSYLDFDRAPDNIVIDQSLTKTEGGLYDAGRWYGMDGDKITKSLEAASKIVYRHINSLQTLDAGIDLDGLKKRLILALAPRAKSDVKRTDKFLEACKNYRPAPGVEDIMKKKRALIFAHLYNVEDRRNQYLMKCGYCGKEFLTGFYNHLPKTLECPACKMSRPVSYNPYPKTGTYLDVTEDGILVKRSFSISTRKDGVDVCETDRKFYGRKRKAAFMADEDGDVWVPDSRSASWYCDVFVQDAEEIARVISRSELADSGIAHACGLVPGYKACTDLPFDEIFSKAIKAYYKCPELHERLAKSGLALYRALLENFVIPYTKGKASLHEGLGVRKWVLKAVSRANTGIHTMVDDLYTLERLASAAPELNPDNAGYLIEHGILDDVTELRTVYSIPIPRIVDYLGSCYEHQCIDNRDALSVWGDYLRMARALHYPRDKQHLYPRSLKKEHDIAMFAYRAVKDKIDEEMFAQAAEKNRKMLEYKNTDFSVIVPSSPADIVSEAQHQHNCMRSYIERVTKGETSVAFIRRNSDPEKSYVSVEVRKGRLVQVKGFGNSVVRDRTTLDFINEWCVKKALMWA